MERSLLRISGGIMRNQLKFIFTALFLIGIGLSFMYRAPGAAPVVTRGPASVEESKPSDASLNATSSNQSASVYRFHREVQANLKLKSMPDSVIDLNLDGKVWVTELSHSASMKLLSFQYEMKAKDDSEIHRSSLPMLVEVSNDFRIGQIKTVKPIQKEEEDELNLLKDFVSLYAYRSDADTTGHYVSQFDLNQNQFHKTKIRYDEARLKNVKLLYSTQSGEVDQASSELLRSEGKEQSKVGDGFVTQITTRSQYKIEKMGIEPAPILRVTENRPLEVQAVKIENYAHLNVKSWETLKPALDRIESLNRSERLSLFHDLTKLLKSDPEKVAEFKKYIESVAREPGRLTFGIGVLATAGTEPAQSALTEWYQTFGVAKNDSQVQHTLLNAFSTADAMLTDSSRKFLRDLADPSKNNSEVVQNAAFALGSSLKKTNDEASRASLLNLLSHAQNESERASCLDAIGNSGDAHFLPTLQDAFTSGTPVEREKAVFAARFMKAESASAILMKGMQDQAPNVKLASIRAIGFQEDLGPYLGALKSCAANGNAECKQILSREN